MNEIFRFMALRPPDTSNPSTPLDITNPASKLQGTLATERNRALGVPPSPTRVAGVTVGSPSTTPITFRGMPLAAFRASGTPLTVAAPVAAAPPVPPTMTVPMAKGAAKPVARIAARLKTKTKK